MGGNQVLLDDLRRELIVGDVFRAANEPGTALIGEFDGAENHLDRVTLEVMPVTEACVWTKPTPILTVQLDLVASRGQDEMMQFRRLGPGDARAVASANELFDFVVRPSWTRRFLEDPNHHLIMAYEEDVAAGFVSGVEMTHPDKGTEMFLYELEVVERFRKQGFGTALVEALAELALERACYGMWVLTDSDNHAALSTYARSGATERSDHVMFSWSFSARATNES